MESVEDIYRNELQDRLRDCGGRSCCTMFDAAFSATDEEQRGKYADILRDYCWQKLHTGHWKDVGIQWREGFALASLLVVCSTMKLQLLPVAASDKDNSDCIGVKRLRINENGFGMRQANDQMSRKRVRDSDPAGACLSGNEAQQLRELLRKLDEASMMGGDLFRPALNVVIENIEDKLESTRTLKAPMTLERAFSGSTKSLSLPKNSLDPASGVAVEVLPALEDFYVEYMGTKPCLIEGVVENWPAFRKWNDLNYLKKVAGFRTVPIEVGNHYLAPEWRQDLVTLSDFIDKYVQKEAVQEDVSVKDSGPRMVPTECKEKGKSMIGYLAQHPLFEQIPKLKKDIITPDYCTLGKGEIQNVNAWFGPSGTVTPLHYDPHHNLLAQVNGRKYIRLYSPECTKMLSPYEDDMRRNSSQIDLDNTDSHYPEVEFVDCLMEAGQMLYIPPKWWHYVRSIDVSFSVSFWWQ